MPQERFEITIDDAKAVRGARSIRRGLDDIAVGTAAMASTSLSVGYVVWVLRGGTLLASMLSAIPAWRTFDPLSIIETFKEDESDEEDRETLVSMVQS